MPDIHTPDLHGDLAVFYMAGPQRPDNRPRADAPVGQRGRDPPAYVGALWALRNRTLADAARISHLWRRPVGIFAKLCAFDGAGGMYLPISPRGYPVGGSATQCDTPAPQISGGTLIGLSPVRGIRDTVASPKRRGDLDAPLYSRGGPHGLPSLAAWPGARRPGGPVRFAWAPCDITHRPRGRWWDIPHRRSTLACWRYGALQ